MKTKILLLSALSGFIFILTSCYREIDVEKYRTTPKIVINCPISPDTVIRASITRTYFFSDLDKLEPEYNGWNGQTEISSIKLRNAKVELYINGTYKEDMKWQALDSVEEHQAPDTFFVSTVIPQAGDKVKIVATTPEYGSAWAEDVVPQRVPIEKIEVSCRKETGDPYSIQNNPPGNIINNNEYYAFQYYITFRDTPGKANYYQLWVEGDVQYIDPIFNSVNSTIDGTLGYDGVDGRGGRVFTDELIDGKEYTIQVKELIQAHYSVQDLKERSINLYSLSESYYQYLLSLEKISASTLSGSLSNIGLAEPLRVYTNVNNGTGILGACQRTNIKINLGDYIPKKEDK